MHMSVPLSLIGILACVITTDVFSFQVATVVSQ